MVDRTIPGGLRILPPMFRRRFARESFLPWLSPGNPVQVTHKCGYAVIDVPEIPECVFHVFSLVKIRHSGVLAIRGGYHVLTEIRYPTTGQTYRALSFAPPYRLFGVHLVGIELSV